MADIFVIIALGVVIVFALAAAVRGLLFMSDAFDETVQDIYNIIKRGRR